MRRLPTAVHAASVLVALVFVAPLVVLVFGALRPVGVEAPAGWDLLPLPPSTEGFSGAFAAQPLGSQLSASALVAAVAVPLSLLVASAAAVGILLLESPRARRRAVVAVVALALVPAFALWVPRFVLFTRAGIVDGPLALIAPALVGTTPLAVLLLLAGYRRVPRELLDAARLAGLGPFAVWWRVCEPLTRPTSYAVAALVFATNWGSFVEPLLYLFSPAEFTLPLGARALAAVGPGATSIALAAALVAALPPLVAFVAAQRRFVKAAAAGLGGLVLLGGCAGGDEPRERVLLQVTADAEEAAVYRELVDAYNAEPSGSEVQLVPVADRKEHLQKLATSFAAGRPPEVFIVNHRNLGPFLRDGALETPTEVDEDAFYPVALDAFTVDGILRCVPQNASSLVVYVNEALAGKAPARWTFAELRARAARLRLPDGTHAIGLEPSIVRLAPFVWSAGGTLTDDDEDAPERFTLRRDVLEDVFALRRDGLTPSFEEAEAQSLEDRFLAGKLAFFFSSRREVPNFRAIEDFAWDVAPFPGSTSVLHSDGMCSSSRGGEAASSFIDWATGPEGQRILARGGRTVPSRRAVAESAAFLASTPPSSNEVFLDAIRGMRDLPTSKNWTAQEDAAGLALEQAFYGRTSLDAALARIARETDGKF